MSSENEEPVLPQASQKKSKKSYTRDFLLSLSELDVCKKLPDGFDPAILSELEDAGSIGFERQRNYGPILQSKVESLGGYGRGNQGRWDTWSTGSSDKDGELQSSDRDSVVQDSGRRFGNQTRRPWQNSEHDGLLGSGAFPRPAGIAGSSAVKGRGNVPYQLNRSTEPYQPPRPYKAVPYSRKDSTDSHNDETFGSTECSSEDRAEEEKKRRASFELMRKEQQKTLQGKHKQNLDNPGENTDTDIMALLGNSVDGNNTSKNKSVEPVVASLSHNHSSRAFHEQAAASRPLVPPGFGSSLADKILSVQLSNTSLASEGGSAVIEKNKHSLSITDSKQDKLNFPVSSPVKMETEAPKVSTQLSIDADKKLLPPILSANSLKPTIDLEKMLDKASIQGANEVWEDDTIIMNDSSFKKGSASAKVNAVIQDHSTTILEKLFSSALSKKSASSPFSFEHRSVEVVEDKQSPAVIESSKFAGWFSEEEKNSEKDLSSKELLSLIVSTEKSGPQASTSAEKINNQIYLNSTSESDVTPLKLPSSPTTTSVIGVPEQHFLVDKATPGAAVLTCEDLEQSILTEVSPSLYQPNDGGSTIFDVQSEKKAGIDDRASQHLLSLLQKGTILKELTPPPSLDIIGATNMSSTSQGCSSFDHSSNIAGVRIHEKGNCSEQTLTLETLFGASFMNALHSAEAPVSAQRGPVGTVRSTDFIQPHAMPMSLVDKGFFSAPSHASGSDKSIHKGDILAHTQNGHTTETSVCRHGVSPVETSKFADGSIEETGALEIQLPEEDSLITISDTVNSLNSDPFSFDNMYKRGEFLLENENMEDLNDKFLNAVFGNSERLGTPVSDGRTRLQKGPLEMVDTNDLHHHLHGRPSSNFPLQMDQARPLYPPLDHLGHRNAHMKFLRPDGMHPDPHHQFPGNHIPPHAFSNMGAPRFDPAAAHPRMLQNMPVPGNFPPHLIQNLPRGVPPSHAINHMPGYVQDINNMHNFPLHNRQPNYGGGLGVGLPGLVVGDGGGAHPEPFERLIEMEMRANSKQIHPSAGVHMPGIYGPENMNLRFR